MKFFDFINQDEIDELPDDPQLAFSQFVQLAAKRLRDETRDLNGNDDNEWRMLQDARHGFMNVVIGAAKRFNVEPFATLSVPRIDQFGDAEYRQFNADLDHYVTQLLLGHSVRGKRDSVAIGESAKDRIRAKVHHLREAVANSNLPESKKNDLLKKIVEFETALNRQRVNMLAVARLAFDILAVPGTMWASYEVAVKLTTSVMQEVAEARVEEDNRKIPTAPKPVALSPPRPEERKIPGSMRDVMDDEIPF